MCQPSLRTCRDCNAIICRDVHCNTVKCIDCRAHRELNKGRRLRHFITLEERTYCGHCIYRALRPLPPEQPKHDPSRCMDLLGCIACQDLMHSQKHTVYGYQSTWRNNA